MRDVPIDAKLIAERCRQAACAVPIPIGGNVQTALGVTISGGLFSTDNHIDVAVPEITKKAYDAL